MFLVLYIANKTSKLAFYKTGDIDQKLISYNLQFSFFVTMKKFQEAISLDKKHKE